MMTAQDIHISVEEVTPELLQQVQSLYQNEPYKIALWEWQFKPRFGKVPAAVVARAGGTVVGFNGTMPVQLLTQEGEVEPAIWSCDFIVHANYRGQGLGGAIKDALFKTITTPIMSLGISDSAYPLLIKKGGQSPVQLSIFHRVIKPTNIKSRLFYTYSAIRTLPGRLLGRRRHTGLGVEELAQLPNKMVIDYLRSRYQKPGEVQVLRDYEYLHWRYVEYPFNHLPTGQTIYRFFSVGRIGQSIAGLVVVRFSGRGALEVVDYLGSQDAEIIAAVSDHLAKKFTAASQIGWNTSAPELAASLLACGFVRKSYVSRFVVFSQKALGHWCLSAGDSDGDFLRDGREYFEELEWRQASNPKMQNDQVSVDPQVVFKKCCMYQDNDLGFYVVNSARDFSLLREEWSRLQPQTAANALFMSWAWQYSWWSVWGNNPLWKLLVVLIYDHGALVGIVPLYTYRRYGLRHYQFLGNAWRLQQSVRSEYIGPLFLSTREAELQAAFSRFFAHLGTGILVVPDTVQDHFPSLPSLVVREDKGYNISTLGNFASYVQSLSAHTRLKLFGRRRHLIDKGATLSFTQASNSPGERNDFFSDLNSFHLLRWGKPCFNIDATRFHQKMLESSAGIVPHLSYLKIDGAVVSVSYNLDAAGVTYNLQSGYIEHFDKKTSLGTLHMGYEIERSFEHGAITNFDFLAGQGKVEDYKRHYRGATISFLTRAYCTNRFIWFLYSNGTRAKSLFKAIKNMWRSKKWKVR